MKVNIVEIWRYQWQVLILVFTKVNSKRGARLSLHPSIGFLVFMFIELIKLINTYSIR